MREPFRKTHTLITILLVIGIILGALIIITVGFYHYLLGTFLVDGERNMLSGYFVNMYLLGFQVSVSYLVSLMMWQRIWRRAFDQNIVLLLGIWMFFGFLILLSTCGLVCTLFLCVENLENAAEASLFRGMELYYTCPQWKVLWDGLQFYRECCGVHNYMDWMKASWMPKDTPQIDLKNDLSEEVQQTEDGVDDSNGCHQSNILAPFACCKHPHRNCVGNNIALYGGIGFPCLNLTQINTEGCLTSYSASMWNLLYILLGLAIILLLVEIILCCLTRCVIWKQEHCDYYTNLTLNSSDDECQPMIEVAGAKTCGFNGHDTEPEQTHPGSSISGLRSNFTPKHNEQKSSTQHAIHQNFDNKSPLEADSRLEREFPRGDQQYRNHDCSCLNWQRRFEILH